MNTKKSTTILINVLVAVIFLVSAIFIILSVEMITSVTQIPNKKNQSEEIAIEWQCLKDNEEAGYYDKLGQFNWTWVPKEYPLEVIIRDKDTKEEMKNITIDNVMSSYHPVEVMRCAVYVLKELNFDAKNFEMLPGYNVTLWKYNFNSEGKELIIFRNKSVDNDYDSDYSYDFRISPNERYISLIKSYGGQEDYALVIKDLDTKEDVFSLKMSEFFDKYPNIEGDFDMIGWKTDGRYFWANIMTGAPTPGYLRIDSNDWSWEAWKTPERTLGGFVPNYTTGWMPYAPSAVWTGMVEMDELVRADAKARGQVSPLYIYNLFTKEQIKIDEVESDPIWNFGPPTWLSDTELEYQLPDGEVVVYKLD